MVAKGRLVHVVYMTNRFDEMVDWYLKVFEARIVHGSETILFATYDEEHHRFAFINLGPGDDSAPAGPPKVHHVAYSWPDLTSLMATFDRLNEMGVRPVTCLRHGPTLSMYYADPDGNQSEFQVDLLDPDAATAFMESEAFAANPIGETFDPDAILERLRAGGEVESLVFRSDQDRVPVLIGGGER